MKIIIISVIVLAIIILLAIWAAEKVLKVINE